MLVVYPLIPENAFPHRSSKSLLLTRYLLSVFSFVYFTYCSLIPKTPKHLLHNSCILSCHLELYFSITIFSVYFKSY